MRKWQIQFERYQDKVDKFEGQWRNAYSLIWDTYCAKDVQVAISELPNFETEIRDDPLKLLEKVKELMHTPEKAKYPVLAIVEIMTNFLKYRQGDKEPLLDYLSRFKSEIDIVYRLWGKNFLDSFSENLPDWDNTWGDEEKRKFKANEQNKFIAVLFLRNSIRYLS